ncbi:diacylglycerol/lipid kinase family protein [Cellulomonas fengjieae]|uniref:NAD(+)/NADH kinase n=1 Tax=Cellulomonas fengjieae TaxID=2819978 RepID=A0ABS3SIR1_9CELL|nr:diacylglycerol kinase family protein [Cellulomonas fengjieae]MBO3085204.1 NAD(+)/NADH kinase [Cellulomonas fengjieae]MBO3100945.1 NAD(+)/NADH kinase [Cellulomonas fengjieae]QVI66227.1 NAD(+)/NADH kinase [Cellulomonas fengjieae]
MTWEGWVAVCAAVVALAALVLAVILLLRQRELRRRIETPGTGAGARELRPARDVEAAGQRVAFVANPSKQDLPALRTAVLAACAARGLPEPLWLETTIADPGVGQARAAVAQRADVVVAIGGDGTVRAVAEGLVGTGVPMGLIPLGTGNLLARNLDLPLSDPMAALRLALEGRDRTIDVGWLRVHRWQSDPDDPVADAAEPYTELDLQRDHIFLVIAGLGFDAAMVADTDEQLKARVGWIAYFVSGMRHLHGRRTRVHVRLDDQPMTSTRLRSLLIGNCGRLPGGITLLPDAQLDDGWLDIAAIDTRGGIAGWAQLFGEVMLQGAGVRNDLPAKIGRIDHTRAQEVRVVVQGGEHVQVDGDIVGRVTELSARVDHGALVVRVATA